MTDKTFLHNIAPLSKYHIQKQISDRIMVSYAEAKCMFDAFIDVWNEQLLPGGTGKFIIPNILVCKVHARAKPHSRMNDKKPSIRVTFNRSLFIKEYIDNNEHEEFNYLKEMISKKSSISIYKVKKMLSALINIWVQEIKEGSSGRFVIPNILICQLKKNKEFNNISVRVSLDPHLRQKVAAHSIYDYQHLVTTHRP